MLVKSSIYIITAPLLHPPLLPLAVQILLHWLVHLQHGITLAIIHSLQLISTFLHFTSHEISVAKLVFATLKQRNILSFYPPSSSFVNLHYCNLPGTGFPNILALTCT
jgi:hypothetical protein